jgi:glyoxylase-like metal-dependent hydrolase (beta-lactamase superfamily II)
MAMLDAVRLLRASGQSRTRFGEVPQFAEGLYELADGVYAWLVPNGSWGETNMGLITGEGRSLLVDTPWDLAFTREMRGAMSVVTDAYPVRTVVNTHSDGDHFWGNQYYKHEEIIASAAALAAMKHVTPRTMTAFGTLGRLLCRLPVRRARQIGRWFQAMIAPYDFTAVQITEPNRTFTGELSLSLGGRSVVLRELGPAHTDGDSIVFVPDASVLFAGDLLFIDSTPPMWSGPPENWLRALDAILAYDARIIVPGHGPLTSREGVLRVRSYLEFVFEHSLNLLAAGVPPTAAASRILAHAGFSALGFQRWDSPERVVTTVHTIYRHAGYRLPRPSALQTLRVLAEQAQLAAAMSDATPARLHDLA